MTHTMSWVEKTCEPFVTYDDEFQIWKRIGKEEYWAYDEDEEGFVPVELVALETFSADIDESEFMEKHDYDWCGEVDNSYRFAEDDENAFDTDRTVFDFAWFSRVGEVA